MTLQHLLKIPPLTFKLLVVALITAQRQLIHDRTASRVIWNQSYDFIIVGAGTAGCTVAKRLTEDPNVNVLLLEAGDAQSAIYNDIPALFDMITDNRPDLQWNYSNVPQSNAGKQFTDGRIPEPRGKTIGGSSSHNQMEYNRGNQLIYDRWANEFGAIGWSYRDVLPYFKRFENNTDSMIVAQSPGYHGTSGPVQITSNSDPPKIFSPLFRAFSELGFQYTDINGPNQLGYMNMQLFINTHGFRSSNGNAYVDPNPNPNNLHIVAKALVTRILFKDLKAIGVDFDRMGQKYKVYANKEVIVSAGAINSPQLLMLSGVGPRSHLKSLGIPVLIDLPVGEHYMNHPDVLIEAEIIDPSFYYPPVTLDTNTLAELYFNKSGRLATSPSACIYFFTSDIVNNTIPNAIIFGYPSDDGTILILDNELLGIRSYGTIRLADSSPYSQPLIDPNFFGDYDDFRDIVDGTRFVFYLLEKTSLAKYLRAPEFETSGCPSCDKPYKYLCTESIECFIRYNTDSSYHPSGGCRMGSIDRPDIVVDPFLRVKHTQNLRVCDASIFPYLPNGNTNCAANMVGEKCSQMIKNRYLLS